LATFLLTVPVSLKAKLTEEEERAAHPISIKLQIQGSVNQTQTGDTNQSLRAIFFQGNKHRNKELTAGISSSTVLVEVNFGHRDYHQP